MYNNNFGNEIIGKPTGFVDAIIGDPDDGQYSKQSICTGNKRVKQPAKKPKQEETENTTCDTYGLISRVTGSKMLTPEEKATAMAKGDDFFLSESLKDFAKDKNQIEIVLDAFKNEEFIEELQNMVKELPRERKSDYPYEHGTLMICIDNGKLFIDRLNDYDVLTEGIFAILTLDSNSTSEDDKKIDSAFSSIKTNRIPLDDFTKKWFSYDIVRDTIRRFVEKHQTLPGGVSYNAFGKIFDENKGFDVKEPPNNIVKLTDDFNSFMASAAEGYSKTILDQRKQEVISLLAKDNLLTPEIKEKILACTAVYEINEIYQQAKIQPATEEESFEISEEAKKYTEGFMQKFRNGYFDKEFNRRRQAEIGYGEPMKLTPENIAKEVEKFGQTLDWLANILPDEFGPCKRTEREESTDLVDKVAALCTEQLSQTRGPQRIRLRKHKPTESK